MWKTKDSRFYNAKARKYDRVHSGSTHFFIDPDRTEANLHRAESSYRREEAHDHSTKLTRLGGRQCWTHTPSWASNSQKPWRTVHRRTSARRCPKIAGAYHYCRIPYSNWLECAQVRILFLRVVRITIIGIPTVTVITQFRGQDDVRDVRRHSEKFRRCSSRITKPFKKYLKLAKCESII